MTMKVKHLFTDDIRPGKLYNLSDSPSSVLLDITYRCNHRCQFCYNEDLFFTQPDIDTQQILHIIKKLSDWGVKEILYLGGEPFLRQDFPKILEVGAKLDITQRVVTNGSKLTNDIAQLIADLDVETGVSLHSTYSEKHDELTGRSGSFKKAVQAINRLISFSAKCFIQFTPIAGHPTDIVKLVDFIHAEFSNAIKLVDVNRLLPQGMGEKVSDSIYPRQNDWWIVLKSFPILKANGIDVRVESTPHCWVYKHALSDSLDEETIKQIISSIRPCYMAINQIAMSPDGRFKLCPGGQPFGPSILEESPQLIWKENPILKKRRSFNFLPSSCVDYSQKKICPTFYECGGGCKMSTPLTSNGAGTNDPLICN